MVTLEEWAGGAYLPPVHVLSLEGGRSSIKEAATTVNHGRTVTLEGYWVGLLGAENVVLGLLQQMVQACNRLVCHRLQNTDPNLAKIHPECSNAAPEPSQRSSSNPEVGIHGLLMQGAHSYLN